MTPPHSGRITPARLLYDELGLDDGLCHLLAVRKGNVPQLDEDKYRYLVKRFWFVTFGIALRVERGEIWYAHRLWTHYLLDALTRLLAWTYWEEAHTADPFMRGRRIERWAPPAQVRGLHDALALNAPDDLLGTLMRTAVAFEAIARVCASRYGFRYPVCQHGLILDHVARVRDALARAPRIESA